MSRYPFGIGNRWTRTAFSEELAYAAKLSGFVAAGVVALLMITAATSEARAEEAEAKPGVSFDGLERVENSKLAMAYIDPNADFSAFKRVKILDPLVAFRSNWRRDQNRGRSRNVRVRDMERIRADMASLFKDVFTEVLEAGGRFEVVDENGDDVLLLRPAIIDLDIAAPDTMSGGRSRTFSTSAGAATVYLELFDSGSGDIIGRAADRRAIRRSGGNVNWSNRASNSADMRRLLRRWADLLRSFLDQYYTE